MAIPTIAANEKTTLAPEVVQGIHSAIAEHTPTRIWNKDAAFWKADPQVQQAIDNRLGWLTSPDEFLKKIDDLREFAKEVRTAGFTSVVLLGMGGSSLCVEVIRDTFGVADGFPKMQVLDSTHPDQILAVERAVDLDHTLFIVASKSGTTLEPESFYNYFWNKLEHLGSESGSHFCAITDPGTMLERLGTDSRFRRVFTNPPDIGGRFSVLTYFGLVPAALMGVDIKEFLSRAASEAALSRAEDAQNPSLTLGVFLATHALAGRDKLTIMTDEKLKSFGYWAEQLIAESTGKEGKGILPIEGEGELPAEALSPDRVYVHLTLGENSLPKEVVAKPDHLELHMADLYDLGAEFFRWEFATAVIGKMLGINPFDEPNVAEAKAATNKVLSEYQGRSALTFPDIKEKQNGIEISGEDVKGSTPKAALDNFLSANVKDRSYIAVMAYLNRNRESMAALADLRRKIELKYHVPVTVGFGPRFLHSTGQLHKGGPNEGVFVQFIDSPKEDAQVPEKSFGFKTLVLGQAIGDYETLSTKKKPVINFNLGTDPLKALRELY